MAEAGPDHEGAWYCAHRPDFDGEGVRNFCPPEGCPKGYCARDAGWTHGEQSPRKCTHGDEDPFHYPGCEWRPLDDMARQGNTQMVRNDTEKAAAYLLGGRWRLRGSEEPLAFQPTHYLMPRE